MVRAQPRLWCALILPRLACHIPLSPIPIGPQILRRRLRQRCRQRSNRHAMTHTRRFDLAITLFLRVGISCRSPVD